MACGIPTGDDAFIYATLDKAADAICLDIQHLFVGITEHSNCHLYLNMLTTVLTKLIDSVGKDGTVTPGLFNDQGAWILGDRSFDHANKENRWRTFLASGTTLADEFWDEYERAKALNLELRSRIVLAADEVLPGSIFDEAIEGFGGISASCTNG